jgi:hypothetical protein
MGVRRGSQHDYNWRGRESLEKNALQRKHRRRLAGISRSHLRPGYYKPALGLDGRFTRQRLPFDTSDFGVIGRMARLPWRRPLRTRRRSGLRGVKPARQIEAASSVPHQRSARTHAPAPRACVQIAPDRPSVAGTPADKRFGNGTSDTSKKNFKGVHQTGSTPVGMIIAAVGLSGYRGCAQ